MHCPKCGYEYREGFTRCPDCNLDLVSGPAPEIQEEEPEYASYVEVLDTFNPFDIAIIKSILDSEGINYYFIGENFGGIYPMATAPKLMVVEDQAEEAKEILKDLSLTYLASHTYEEDLEGDEPDPLEPDPREGSTKEGPEED